MSQAQTLYVATNGNDANSGSIDAPLRSISAAASEAGPGTQILVQGGTYTGPVSISHSGAASSPIVVQPYAGEHVTIDGSNLSANADLVTISGNDVNFQGFDVANAPGNGIVDWATHDDTLANNTVHGSGESGIWVGGNSVGQSYNNAVLNNTVDDNVMRNAGGGKPHPAALSVDLSDNAQIGGNSVYDNYGEGIDSLQSDHAVISQNTVHDNYNVNVYLDNAPDSIVNRNFIYSLRDSRFYTNGHPAEGIGAAVESYPIQRPDSNFVITNNIDVGDDHGLYYGAYGHGGGMQNALVSNNTFVNDQRSNLDIEGDTGSSGNNVVNNIFDNIGSGVLAAGSSSGFQFDHNLWFGGSYSGFAGPGDVNADPKLFSAGSLDPASYALQSGSPAIGAGSQTSQVATDFSGASRDAAISIGAYQS